MTGTGTTDAATGAPALAAAPAAPAAAPVTVLTGADSAMVCEGDVCYVPGFAEPGEGDPA